MQERTPLQNLAVDAHYATAHRGTEVQGPLFLLALVSLSLGLESVSPMVKAQVLERAKAEISTHLWDQPEMLRASLDLISLVISEPSADNVDSWLQHLKGVKN